MKILQFGDLHLEKGNLDISIPPLLEIVEIARSGRPDLAIFTGDAVTKRGAFLPASAWEFRNACEAIAEICPLGLVTIDGNHDVLFDGSPSFIVGALADSSGIARGKIRIVSGAPKIFDFPGLVVAAIPTFDRYRLKIATEEVNPDGSIDSAEGVVGAAVRGVLAEAAGIAGDRPIVAVYHGALNGSVLGNEQIIRSGIDVPVDPAAFHGANVVLLGHIHKPQALTSGGVPLIYNGASCPLSWSENNIEPSVPIVSIEWDEPVKFERIPLPVVSQMIERTLEISTGISDFPSPGEGMDKVPDNSRLRLTVRGPATALATIKPGHDEELARQWDLRSVDILKESTEDREHILKIDRRLSMPDAVGVWYDHRGTIEGEDFFRKPLLELAEEIETEVIDERLDAKFDFRPVNLTVNNWCQYDEAEIPFPEMPGVTIFRGRNTSGKSNLVRALPFALYKIQKTGDVLADLIRIGEKSAEVVLVFKSGGDTYRIRRILKRGSRPRTASSVLFFEQAVGLAGPLAGDRGWGPVVEGTEPETQAKINALVGPSDLFFASSYADQGAISSLLEYRPSEMKDLFATVLHRNFEGRVEKVRDRRREAEKTAERDRVILDTLDSEAAGLVDVDEDLRLVVEAEETRPFVGRDALPGKRARVEDLVIETATLRTKQNDYAAMVERLTAVRVDLAKVDKEIVDFGDLDKEAAAMKEIAGGRDSKLAELGALKGTVPGFESSISRERGKLEEVRTSRTAENSKYSGLILEKRTDQRAAEIRLAGFEEALEEGLRAAERVAAVPCEGGLFDITPDKTRDGADCPLIAAAVEKGGKDNLDAIRGDLTDCKDELEAAAGDVEDLQTKAKETDAAFGETITEILETIPSFEDRKREVTERVDELDKELEKIQAAANTLAKLEGRREALEQVRLRKSQIQDETDDLIGKIGEGAPGEDLIQAEGKLGLARRELADLEASIKAEEEAVADLAKRRAILEEKKARLVDLVDKRTAKSGAIADLEFRVANFRLYEEALGRDGVPFLLVERFAVPEIQDRMNHYLEPTPWRVTIETERSSVTAGLKPGVYISFTDGRGTHPASAASGAQEVAIGSSLRQAVSDLHGSATGTNIRLSVQDEGFGAFDEENLKGALETIQRIAASREYFLFVSHIAGMEETADNIVEVQASDTGSTISIEKGVLVNG